MKYRAMLLAVSFFGSLCAVNSEGAEIVYDNSENSEGTFNDTRLEAGDQITIEGTERLLTEFAFEYFAGFQSTGDEMARVRFYYNDGADLQGLRKPGTLFYDSGPFSVESGYRTIRGVDQALLVPSDTFTWTVEFTGVTAEESAGLLNYDPPTIGSSGDFFWQKVDGDWQAVASEGSGNNFAARFFAEQALTIRRIGHQAGTATVTASSIAGRGYALEFTRSLGDPVWRRTGGTIRATGNQVTLQDPHAAGDPRRFYRVIERSTTIDRTNGQATITAAAVPGESYALESTTNFTSWAPAGSASATGQTVTFTVPLNEGTHRFFRVVRI